MSYQSTFYSITCKASSLDQISTHGFSGGNTLLGAVIVTQAECDVTQPSLFSQTNLTGLNKSKVKNMGIVLR